jgi:hypothetical protein
VSSPEVPAERARSLAGPLLVAVVAFAVYLRTLMPEVAFGDWAEMQSVPHLLGIAHPTGYPTYILSAWLFELIPIGSVAFRANLFSAILVAAALATLSLIAQRLGVRPLLGAAAALALAAVGTVWSAATVARMDPLHLLFVALLVHRALCWADQRRPRDLLIAGLLLGLALGNHLLTLAVAPFLFAFVAWAGRHDLLRRPWLLLAAPAATLAGLAVYLYIPLAAAASPPLAYNHPTTLDGVLWLLTGTQFRGQFSFLSPQGPGVFFDSLPGLWQIVVSRATPVMPVVGLAGLLVLIGRRPAFGLACIAILAAGIYVWATYQQVEQHYLLVPFLMLAIGVAVALEWAAHALTRLLGWLRTRTGGRARSSIGLATAAERIATAGVGVAALAFAIGLGAGNWADNDRSQDRSGPDYVDAVFDALPPNAAIVSYWDPSTPLWYGRFVQGRRPDILIVDDTNIVYEGWGTAEARIASLICERHVFVMRTGEADLAPIRARYRVEKFMDVRVGALSPSALLTQQVYRVETLDPSACSSGT